jgi:hypothetical protein
VKDWLEKIREVGSRAWNALYQGRPAPAEGTILKRAWWKRYEQPLWLERPKPVQETARLVRLCDESAARARSVPA